LLFSNALILLQLTLRLLSLLLLESLLSRFITSFKLLENSFKSRFTHASEEPSSEMKSIPLRREFMSSLEHQEEFLT
jgi:hypothetical protein